MKTRILTLCVITSLALADGETPPADGWGEGRELLADLQKRFAEIETMQANFIQRKELKLFRRPLEITGTLTLQVPDRLAWRVEAPVRHALILDGAEAKQWDEETDKVETRSMAKDPVFAEALGQMQAWFSGRFGELEGDYALEILSRDPVELAFTPREGIPAAKVVQRIIIRLRADRAYVEAMTLEERNGNRTVIRFTDTVMNPELPKDAWKVRRGG